MTAPASPIDAAPARVRRLDVQGLRAVASLLVASYHIWFGTVSGGVDVFFVLGGYLLVTSLVGEVERSGRLDVGGALRRQASRLLPMMGLVLAASAILAYLLRPPSLVRETSWDLLAAATYWENWRLAATSVDYVEGDGTRSIVQHFWAMGVQGQWTLGAIVLVAIVALVLRARAAARIRPTMAIVLGVVAVASFAYALVAVSTSHASAYFDTGARTWELAVGGVVALVGSRIAWRGAVRVAVGGAALVVLLLAGLLPATWHHPGLPTLVPVVAAIALLLAGAGRVEPTGVGRVLATRPLVWLGGISYGVYLWHWPVLWLFRARGGAAADAISVVEGVAILAAAVALSWLSTRLLRAIAGPRSWRVPLAALLVPAVAAGALGVMALTPRITSTQLEGVDLATPGSVDEVQDRVRAALAEPSALAEGFAFGDEARSPEWVVDGCVSVQGDEDLDRCRFDAPEDGSPEVWIVGDSQAVTWAPAVRAAVDGAMTVQLLGSSMCPFTQGPVVAAQTGEQFAADCAAHNEWVVELAQRREPSVVVVSYGAWWVGTGYEDRADDSAEQLAAGTLDYVERLQASGATVVWLDGPPPATTAGECIDAQGLGRTDGCVFALEAAQLERQAVLEGRFAEAGTVARATMPWFCDVDAQLCPIVVEGVPVYADSTHMSWAQSVQLQLLVAEAISEAGGIVVH